METFSQRQGQKDRILIFPENKEALQKEEEEDEKKSQSFGEIGSMKRCLRERVFFSLGFDFLFLGIQITKKKVFGFIKKTNKKSTICQKNLARRFIFCLFSSYFFSL